MTSVLRDSLGGNCKTVMVGTAAIEDRHLEESMSTCRFAQRVAAIKNNATVNEELDPALLIRRLKKEAAELKDELKLLNGEAEELNAEDKEECKKLVQGYLVQQDLEAPFVGGSISRFQECFRLLREVYLQKAGGAVEQMSSPSEPRLGSLEATLNQLRQEVAMRDQEINMLVGSLSKRGNNAKEAARAGPVFIPGAPSGSNPPEVATSRGPEALSSPGEDSAAVGDPTALLLDRNKAFDAFRRSVRRSETLDDGREAMKQLVVEAKEVGELANAARASVQVIQKKIEKARLGRVLGTGPHDPTSKENAVPPDTPEIATLNHTMEVKISTYKKSMERLKWVKAEIEKYRSAAEENKERLQRDFEAWYLSLQAHQASVAGAEAVRPASAQSPAAVVESSPRSNSAQESRKAPGAHEGVLAASGVPQEPPATSLTGHQQTDDDIRAYFAAVANLESR